jgi:predicted phage baseplate assembly protein
MPIQPPSLDDRDFDDLVADLLARIPSHTPEWTDPRPGDPGRTVLELFAWLADTLLYRANLTPEKQRLAFLRLLGQPLKPAVAAEGWISLSHKRPEDRRCYRLRPLASVSGAAVPVETRTEVTVLPLELQVYGKERLSAAEAERYGVVVAGLASLYDIQADQATPYVTRPIFQAGQLEPAGYSSAARTVDGCFWLALLAADQGDGEKQDAHNRALLDALGGEEGRETLLSVGVVPTLALPPDFSDFGARLQVPHLWEISAPVLQRGEPQFQPLRVVEDSSEGLLRPGVIRLALPDGGAIGVPGSNDVRQFMRAGVGAFPPRLDDAATAARLVAWIRLRPLAPAPPRGASTLVARPPDLQLSWLGINVVAVDQRRTLRGVVVGQSTGDADQEFSLPSQSVEPDSLEIEVEEAEGYRPWRRIDCLDLAGRDDAVFSLDSEAGLIRFGDGLRGRIPEFSRRIRVASLRAGGGRDGNLPAGTLSSLSAEEVSGELVGDKLRVRQPLPLAGGEDAELLAAAEKRIPALLRHRDRAVTAEDYEALAAETPGVRLGRVALLPLFKPQQRDAPVPGVVSVLVLPQQERRLPPNPRPDRPTLERVHSWLDQRRPLATELYVIGCEYLPLGVGVGVEVRGGFGQSAVLQGVTEALRTFLWPLAPGGLEERGWPLGQKVRERELEVVVARVPGVAAVGGVRLFSREGASADWGPLPSSAERGAELRLANWQLPELQTVVVNVGAPPATLTTSAAGGDGTSSSGSGSSTSSAGSSAPGSGRSADVAIPIMPEVC